MDGRMVGERVRRPGARWSGLGYGSSLIRVPRPSVGASGATDHTIPRGFLMSTTESNSPLRTLLVIGSTRAARGADLVLPWLTETLSGDERLELEIADLRDWPLPFFQEDMFAMGDPADPTYSDPIVKRWNDTVKAAEAFIFLTPEYNHTIPAALKNAVDSIYMSNGLRNKPSAFVGYSVSPTGAVRAIEHMYQAVTTLESVPIRNGVLVGDMFNAFDNDGQPTNPMTAAAMQVMRDDLVWWGNALRGARGAGELAPYQLRIGLALAELQATDG